jgi:predicted DsbA family dithiol-disulfide isomerase
MGGLTDNAEKVHDPANGIGGDDWKRQVAAHWLDASSRHGMPVDVTDFVSKVAPSSTHPANIAYEAAKLQKPELADRYLRQLREAAAIEGRSIHLPEVQADIAEALGYDRARFLHDLAGPAKEAFAADLRDCYDRGIRGFPTFLVRSDGHEVLMRGYNKFPSFAAAFNSVVEAPLIEHRTPISEDAVLAFIAKYESAATREVSEVFVISDAEAEAILQRLVVKREIEAQSAGTGTMYRAPRSGECCDSSTGRCM